MHFNAFIKFKVIEENGEILPRSDSSPTSGSSYANVRPYPY
jgi:hypothetical protein